MRNFLLKDKPGPISCPLPIPYSNIAPSDIPAELLFEPKPEPEPVHIEADNDHTQLPSTTSIDIELRRSSRHTHRPACMQDFECYYSNISPPAVVHSVNSVHTKFVDTLSKLQEPRSYVQTTQHQAWIQAMDAEIQALEHNQTWEITPLPKDKKAIGSRWIYKLKLKPDGTVDRHKARLVAKGYTQVEGVDFFESFSPVAKVVTVRVLLALAASNNWHVHQLDVNNAFLHGNLDEKFICSLSRDIQYLPVMSASSRSLYMGSSKLPGSGTMNSPPKWNLLVLSNIRMITAYLLNLLMQVLWLYLYAGMTKARAATTPLPTVVKFMLEAGSPLPNAEVYRRLIGRLLYLGSPGPKCRMQLNS
ncbi:UNVERIFIED_CONTAM: Retrovirus-related Pol polyprotein from transposon RE2 [Sesamum radiatum]|uniref:Retrovirus-related Pol polyprotein from transposon RE2 n=1 Tax=Sesamum radiatum TaxID=300843 RepID=A0AAW2RC55_SESRA